MNPQKFNVFLLGSAFHLIFFSFQTSVFIQQTVVNSIKTKPGNNFSGDGYISLCITYSTFALSNWLAPSIIALTGLKYGMFLGSITYILYSADFIYPTTYLFYAAAALNGFGAGPLWAAQGSYLAKNSDEETSSRNAAIFWSMLQSSFLFGNLFVYFAFSSQTVISDETRYIVYGVLTSVCALGATVILFLRENNQTFPVGGQELSDGALGQFLGALKLAKTINMILLSVAFLFTGQLLSFFTGIYGTAIGATPQFGADAKEYIGLSGIFIGIGEIFGGSIFGLMGSKVTGRLGERTIFTLGFMAIIISSALIYLNLPADASIVEHAKLASIIEPSSLLGFGDACFNTQIYALLISAYSDNSTAAFALFKFVQSLGAAMSFLYSTKLDLHIQLYLIALVGTIATMNFYIVAARCKRKPIIEKSESQQSIVATSDGCIESDEHLPTSRFHRSYESTLPILPGHRR